MKVSVKEFDGGRSVEISSDPDFVYLEVAGHCLAFDRSMFIHGVKRSLGTTLCMDEGLRALLAQA